MINFCEDEGCPQHGTKHVCLTTPLPHKANDGLKGNTILFKVPNSNSPQLNLFAAGAIFVCVPLGLVLITLKVLGVL